MRERREQLGLTQAEAVQCAENVSESTWRSIERGTGKKLTLRTVVGVTTALQWPPDALDRIEAGEDPAEIEDIEDEEIPEVDDPMTWQRGWCWR